ncbi:MAG: ATP synthase F1 subunit epsilon [Candidatus Eremiobacteraeota bacterium]|nr:ATP synthase F1 subunit epsilon [Candidatus Eremiobacteraeota bacterium]MBC5828382.1 ATP synthase F1 subunit epsilon [Candidatus Eremiobacteraeota bacterium]
MPSTTALSIVTPAETKYEGEADIVVAPGSAGDLAALVNHAPLLTTLRIGVLRATVRRVQSGEGKPAVSRISYAVNGGFMEVLARKVVVLTDVALSAGEVDVDQAAADLKRGEEALSQKRGQDDRAERDAVAWASARLEVAKERP